MKGFMKVKNLIAVTLVLGLLVAFFPTNYAYADESIDSNWMAQIDDETYISSITLPGTHDSATQYVGFSYFMRCQNTSISEQLENGFRYVDLRVSIDENDDGNRLKIVHNFANCHVSKNLFSDKLTFTDVTSMIYAFLDENPTEMVMLNIKIEDDDHSVSEVQDLLYDEIFSNAGYWYTDSSIPTLGEVRGKIVLATRFDDEAGYGATGIQLQWDEQGDKDVVDVPYELYVLNGVRLWVQDRYNYDVDDKYDAVVDGLENCEADDNTIFLNFVSTTGSGSLGHPKGYAKQLNKLLLDYELQENTSYGIIIVDFGTSELAEHIYNTNL